MYPRILRLLFAAALSLTTAAQSWPNGPFVTEGSSILDASGNNVTYAGVNVGRLPFSDTDPLSDPR